MFVLTTFRNIWSKDYFQTDKMVISEVGLREEIVEMQK